MSELRGRKRKQSSEKLLEQELELLKAKCRKLQEQITSGAANASTEGNNNRGRASDAGATDRSSLDEGYTSSGAAMLPKPPLESVAKQINENESQRRQRHALSPKHNKDSQVIKSRNRSPTSLDGVQDNISIIKPPSPGTLYSKDVTFNHQTVIMQSLLMTEFRKLEEQITSGAANASTVGNNNRCQASDAGATDRSSLDEGYTSSGAAILPKLPLEPVAKQIHENESQLRQRHALSPKHNKDSQVIKSRNRSPTSLDGIQDNISRIKPPSPGLLHSKDVTFNHQTVSMQSQHVSKTESSVTLVNNINQVSIAKNLLYMPPDLPMCVKKLYNIPPASREFKEEVLTNKRLSSPPTNNILPEMAERLHSVLQNGLPNEERYHLQEKYKIPNNCTLMKAPCLNPEVIPFMNEVAKKRDSGMLKYQDKLGAGMAAIAEGVTQVSRTGDGGVRSAMEHIHRGLHLLADLHYHQTIDRRIECTRVNSRLKSFLVEKLNRRRHDFHDIKDIFKRDDTVFGRDIF